MSGRLSQTEKPQFGRISSYKPTVQDVIDRNVPDTTQQSKLPPQGLIKKVAKSAGRLGQTAVNEIRTNPKGVARNVPDAAKTVAKAGGKFALELPNYIAGGIVGLGRTVMEATLPRIIPGVTKESLRADVEKNKENDEYWLKGEVPSWQKVKEDVDAFTEQSPDALPAEKKYLGGALAIAGFAADSTFGGGTSKQISKQIIKEIAGSQESEVITTLIKKELPNLSDKQHTILGDVLKDVEDPKKVQTILDSFVKRVESKKVAEESKPAGRLTSQQESLDFSPVKSEAEATAVAAEKPVVKSGADLQKEFGSTRISEDFKKTELEAFDHISKTSTEKLADDFIKTNGKVVSTDRAKSLFPKYVADRTLSDAVQKPARMIADVAYEKLLKSNKGKGSNVVRIYGGGTGSGKSAAIREGETDASIVFEANLTTPQSAIERIDRALEEGYDVDLQYVYRDPAEAFKNGVLKRKRTVTIDGHIGTHISIPETAIALAKHYADDSRVDITVLDNSRGKGQAQEVDDVLDFFSKVKYNKSNEDLLRRQLQSDLEESRRQGSISESTYIRTKGEISEGGSKSQQERTEGSGNGISEEDSLELLATQEAGSEYALKASAREEDRIVSNLESVFADLKGVDVADLQMKFTEEDLNKAELNYQFAMESLLDDPARSLSKYANRNGVLPEVTGTEFITSPKGKGQIKNSRFGREGDDISSQLGFKSSEEARAAYIAYTERKARVTDILNNLQEIRRNIRLAKQADNFIGKEKNKLAAETAKNLKGLQAIVQAAERAGFRKGISEGNKNYHELVSRLRERRKSINAIKTVFNLTDEEMKAIRGAKDPRFMTKEEFDKYLEGVNKGAEARHKTNQERLLVEAIIQERDLKKVENLQKALQFPRVEKMSHAQLVEFGDILSKTDHGDTFLGPRMIQTAVNTDLGNIRTLQEGRKKIAEQTGMPFTDTVAGDKNDRWLRDSTLVEKDPLHKMFITEWVAKEADMLTRQHALQEQLNKLANASRKSRKRGIFDRLAPQDTKAVDYAQTLPEHLPRLEKDMTPEEIEFGKFLRGFFEKYYQFVQEDAAQRWTLQGVKYSRFKDMYFPHMTRGFFERWKEDGFVKAVKILWDQNVAESKIDFNAFGDRGEVLGYEKWFKNNMKREAEKGAYTKNAASTALAYFHAFEKKLLLDSMVPKIKLLEFLVGKRFQTPKSIDNPEGTEKVHSVLSKSLNEWINNKKGQRIEMLYAQGDRAEAFVDAASMFVSLIDLGGNIAIQLGSGVGGAVVSARGAGLPKYALGVKRALTSQGRKIGKENPGIIGTTPWFDLASVANDAGDTLRNALFSGFGDLAYRARRHMFLGLLTKEEFTSGVISKKRLAEIKLQIGKWHPLPEFDSVAGSTSLISAAGKYTSWATPIFQTAMTDLARLKNELRRLAGTKDFETFVKSPGFRNTLHTALIGVGAYALGQVVFRPEEEDRDTLLGNMRYVAARESGTIMQGATAVGVLASGRMLGFVQDAWNTAVLLATLQRYETYGEGYKPGDLEGLNSLQDLITPKSIKQFLPEETTPLKTENDIKKEILAGIESGELTVSAAKEKYKNELEKLEEKRKDERFKLSPQEYKADMLKRIESEEITVAKAKKEYKSYIEAQKKFAPESFESDSESTFIEKVKVYAEAAGTDPVTAFAFVFQGESIRRTDNGTIIVHRGKSSDPEEQKEFSINERKERGANKDLILDHTVPLQLGGSNSDKNLKLVPKEEWEEYTPVENFLGKALRDGDITGKKAQELIKAFKEGKLTAAEVYAQVD